MASLSLRPDFEAPPLPLRHTWAGMVNIDQFKWLSWSKVHEALAMARDEIGARSVRAVGMYGHASRVWDRDPTGFRNPDRRQPRTNHAMIHTYFDGCVDLGVTPVFTTCFTPDVLAEGTKTCFDASGNITPPRDLGIWSAFVEESVRLMAHRYGRARLRDWWFEVWNEPNLEGSFWLGGKERWLQLWEATHRAIKRVDPHFRVGGPSTARGEWIDELLTFGRNADCLPDYIITHVYNNDSASQPLSPFDGPPEHKLPDSPHFASGVIRGVRDLCRDRNFPGPIHWNEWGRSWFPYDPDRESEIEAAFIGKTMAEVSDCADVFAYWALSDIYNQVGYGRETFHGNYGMLSQANIRKPSYLAHQLLERLGSHRYPCLGPEPDSCTGAWVAGDDLKRQILAYAFPKTPAEAGEKLSIQIEMPAHLPWHLPRLFRLTSAENNSPTRWRQTGSETYLSPSDARRWKESSALRETPLSELHVTLKNGSRRVGFELPGFGLALLEWSLEPCPEPLRSAPG